MSAKPKDSQRIFKLEKAAKASFDARLATFEDLSTEIPMFIERMRGYAEGREEPQYQFSKGQYQAMMDLIKLHNDFNKEKEKNKEWLEDCLANSAYADRFKNSVTAGGHPVVKYSPEGKPKRIRAPKPKANAEPKAKVKVKEKAKVAVKTVEDYSKPIVNFLDIDVEFTSSSVPDDNNND